MVLSWELISDFLLGIIFAGRHVEDLTVYLPLFQRPIMLGGIWIIYWHISKDF